MQLAFCLYKYFPFGGLQRDFLRIALSCRARGHAIRVYALEWTGEVPDGFEVIAVPVSAFLNARRYELFSAWMARDLALRPADRVIGFNKMPGLDVYFAADPCFEEKARASRNPLYRLSGRYRHFSAYERAVFAPESRTEILTISPLQQVLFEKYYGTPRQRFHPLPPGISRDRRAPADAARIRADFRREFALDEDALLLVQIGSGFKTKGLDRSLQALAHLPETLRRRARLIAIGQDDAKPFLRQAAALGIAERVAILPGRGDIPRFLLGADLLIHPAYSENTGTVLLEALVAGLPVLTTAVCGYAHYVEQAGGGCVVAEPFSQRALDATLEQMLSDPAARGRWRTNALRFAETADVYDNAERAADVILGTTGSFPSTPVTGHAEAHASAALGGGGGGGGGGGRGGGPG
ncbi:MAG: glycosyltransferase family 4 protein, partial [Candidatus Accumulibacter sp.]|nr:glycosyltransferase family 4 protein [Accumulibacter sp.]